MKYRLKHVLEYAALRPLALVLSLLPYRLALLFGWLHAWVAHHVFRFRVRQAHRRIRETLGSALSERDIRRIAWLSWRNIVFAGIEFLRISRMSRRWIERHTDHIAGCRRILDLTGREHGAVLALPHMGNWEIAATAATMTGIPLFAIAATQKNPLTARLIDGLRDRPGRDTLARGSGMLRQVLRRLRQGGRLAILPDVRVRTEGVPTPFLGGEANLGPGMALFARQANVPIIICVASRRGWVRHHLEVSDPIYPDRSLDREADIRRMTHTVMRRIEDRIRRDPSQWFWYNKRWILDPL